MKNKKEIFQILPTCLPWISGPCGDQKNCESQGCKPENVSCIQHGWTKLRGPLKRRRIYRELEDSFLLFKWLRVKQRKFRLVCSLDWEIKRSCINCKGQIRQRKSVVVHRWVHGRDSGGSTNIRKYGLQFKCDVQQKANQLQCYVVRWQSKPSFQETFLNSIPSHIL